MAQMRLPVDYKKEVHKSVFDLSTVRRTTLHPGMIIPIYSRRMMAGDKFIIDINALLKSTPLNSPLYGTFKLQTAVFFDSDTNYYGYLDNNTKQSTQDLLAKRCHYMDVSRLVEHPSDDGELSPNQAVSLRNGQFNNFRGSLLEYMGVPSGFYSGSDREQRVDVGFILTYMNIVRNYFVNKQCDYARYSNGWRVIENVDTEDEYFSDIKISDLDDFFMKLRSEKDGQDIYFSFGITSINEFFKSFGIPYGGLFLTTYLPDLYRNLLDDTFNTKVSKVSTTGNEFTIDSLRFANKLQRLVDRFDISGGRFSDWLRTVWGVETRKDLDIPEIIGVSQSLIDPSQVTATGQTGERGAEGSTDLGQFGGNFDNFNRQRKYSFTASTPGRVMVTVTLVPMVDYSQGIDPELLDVNFADRYFPEFENLGYQKVPYKWYSMMPSLSVRQEQYSDGTWNTPVSSDISYKELDSSVGKQVAWLPLMTDTNRVYGEFGNGGYYESWVLKRLYNRHRMQISKDDNGNTVYNDVYSFDLTQYINPLDYQYPFMAQSLSDPNWFLQMALEVKAVRPKGKRFMPNLE